MRLLLAWRNVFRKRRAYGRSSALYPWAGRTVSLLAQAFHTTFIERCVPALRMHSMLAVANGLDLNDLRWSVYIDDLSILAFSEDEVNHALEQYCVACNKIGLAIKPSKLQRASSSSTEITGMLVNGEEFTVGVSPAKLAILCKATMLLARAPSVKATDVSSVVGKWAWAFLARRPAFCVFGSVYRWLHVFDDAEAPLWPSARLELAMACALAPLLSANIAEEWFDEIVAVDASMDGQGVVSTRADEALISRLASLAGRAPIDTMRPNDLADPSLRRTWLRDANVAQALLLDDLSPLRDQRWYTVVSKPWRRREHINVLEATALRTAVRWIHSRSRSAGRRLLVVSDSAVVVMSHSKGRSSSLAMLSNCRRTAAYLLASGLHLFLRWIPSALNWADAASRSF
jgi:hypothetical protein